MPQPVPCKDRKKKALLIAIHEVQGREDLEALPYAHRDARALRDRLIEQYGYHEEDVVLMLDLPDHPKKLWPTKTNIVRAIRHFVRDPIEGGHYFFYFSGHGAQRLCTEGTEFDGEDEEIVTANGECIQDNFLHEKLILPLERIDNGRLFALFDCCHSETMLDLGHGHDYSRQWEGGPGRALKGVFKSSVPLLQLWKGHATEARNIMPEAAGKAWLSNEIESTPRMVSHDDCVIMKRKQIDFHILSLSACRDSQFACDDLVSGTTMTRLFLNAISKKGITWLELHEQVNKGIETVQESRRCASSSPTDDIYPDNCFQQSRLQRSDGINLNDEVVF